MGWSHFDTSDRLNVSWSWYQLAWNHQSWRQNFREQNIPTYCFYSLKLLMSNRKAEIRTLIGRQRWNIIQHTRHFKTLETPSVFDSTFTVSHHSSDFHHPLTKRLFSILRCLNTILWAMKTASRHHVSLKKNLRTISYEITDPAWRNI